MKNFKEFKLKEQGAIASKVAGYVEFLLRKNDPSWTLKEIHLDRVTEWLFNNNIEINPKTKMIPHSQTTNMLKACFNQ